MGIRDRIKEKVTDGAALSLAVVSDTPDDGIEEWFPDLDAAEPDFNEARVPLGPTGGPLSAFDQPIIHGLRLPPMPETGARAGSYLLPLPLRTQWMQTVEALALRGVYRAEDVRALTGLPLTLARRFLRAVGRQWEARGAVPVAELRGVLLGQAQEVGRVAFGVALDDTQGIQARLTALQMVLSAGKRQADLVGAESPKNVKHEHGGAVGLAVGVVHRVDLPADVLAAIGRAAAVERVGSRVIDVEAQPDPATLTPTRKGGLPKR